jgi:hypothetical protein
MTRRIPDRTSTPQLIRTNRSAYMMLAEQTAILDIWNFRLYAASRRKHTHGPDAIGRASTLTHMGRPHYPCRLEPV